MQVHLDGATRVHFIVGDPIAQVKAPGGVTEVYQQRGLNAVVLPAHVSPAALKDWFRGISLAQNVDAVIATVPHKFACHALCDLCTERADFLRAVNVIRRLPDGRWQGDMVDGLGYVEALRANGCEPKGRTALVVGAGGAGSAIAHALVVAGVSRLAIHDESHERRDALVARLGALGLGTVEAGSPQTQGMDIAINATPAGMREGDALPLDLGGLAATATVGCVVTLPAVTPLIAQARAQGFNTVTGTEMFARVRDLMVTFLTGD